VIISDFLTPKGSTDFIYPQALVDEIETRFGPYPLYLKTPMFSANLSPANLEAFLEELHHELQYKFQVTHYLMDRYAPDFTMLHIWGTDRVQHELWNLLDAGHPRYDRTLAARYGDRIVEYFRQVDAAIGRLEARLDGNATFFIVSDHGFGPVHREIDLNVWLLQEGYIAIKRSPLSQLRFLAWKTGLTYEFLLRLLLKAMRRRWLRLPDTPPAEGLKLIQEGLNLPLLSMKDVDWARTRAYAKHGVDTGAIHLNIVGRERHGSVTPGKEYEALQEEIVQKLRALMDPATRQPVGGEIYTKEELYHGDHLDDAPDIVFLPMANNYLAEALLTFTTRRPIVDNYTFPGNHRMDGILMAKGKPVRANCHIDGAQIIDMAPTILYLMGSPVPKDMDGEVLTDMFTDEFLDGHPLERADPPPEESNAGYAMSPSDEAHIVRRLQDMGYL
jgi:predicted AlkP superfamily phosphohydrolase/phosphomutase